MRTRLTLIVGAGIGYYLGAKAGRQRYEQMNRLITKARRSRTADKAGDRAKAVAEVAAERAKETAATAADLAKNKVNDLKNHNGKGQTSSFSPS